METIKIYPTKTTPAVYLNPTKGIFKMYGRSSTDDSIRFYQPLRSALTSGSMPERLMVKIKMEYFNTSTSKCLYDIFRDIKSLMDSGKKVAIKWYYEQDDDDMLEAGEDYCDLLGLPFSFVEYAPNYHVVSSNETNDV